MIALMVRLSIQLIQIRGRHRGLPYALDKAIMLPKRAKPEDEAGGRRPLRRMSIASSSGIDRGRTED